MGLEFVSGHLGVVKGKLGQSHVGRDSFGFWKVFGGRGGEVWLVGFWKMFDVGFWKLVFDVRGDEKA